MKYNELCPDISASALGLGVMRYDPNSNANFSRNIDYAIEHGVNYFEACWFYLNGKCESLLTNALCRHKRDSYLLSDKMPVHGVLEQTTPDNIWPKQLRNCKTDYFDLYLLQALDRRAFELIERHDLINFVDKKKKEGSARKIGFSFHDTPEYLEKFLKMYDWDFVQLQLNYYDWFWTMGKELYEIADKYNTNIVVMGPVKGGTLVNNLPVEAISLLNDLDYTRSTASWAMRFLATLPRVKVILSGAEHFDALRENVELFEEDNIELASHEIATLEKVIDIYRKKNYIHCTGCGYCKCPCGIDISKILSLYNGLIKEYTPEKMAEMVSITKSPSGIFSCRNCGRCEKMCPQHLPIREYINGGRLFQLRA